MEPVALLSTLVSFLRSLRTTLTRATGERVTTRGSSWSALHTAKSLYQNRENLQAAVTVPVNVPLRKFKVVFIGPFAMVHLEEEQAINEPVPDVPRSALVPVVVSLAAYG